MAIRDTEVQRLVELIEEAATFFEPAPQCRCWEQDDLCDCLRDSRVAESIAISNLITVATHPSFEEIEAAAFAAVGPRSHREFFRMSRTKVEEALYFLTIYLFAPKPKSYWLELPNLFSFFDFDGRLRLRRTQRPPSIRTGPAPLLFEEEWKRYKDNPRRDLAPYLHEILSPEETEKKRLQPGAVRSSYALPNDDSEKVKSLTFLLRKASEALALGPKGHDEALRFLLQAVEDEDIASLNLAGTRLLRLYPHRDRATDALHLVLPLMFGARRYGSPDEYPWAPLEPQDGVLKVSKDFTHGESFEHWEGKVYFLSKLYERRDLSSFHAEPVPA